MYSMHFLIYDFESACLQHFQRIDLLPFNFWKSVCPKAVSLQLAGMGLKTKVSNTRAQLVKLGDQLLGHQLSKDSFIIHWCRGPEVWGRPERLPSLFPQGDRGGREILPPCLLEMQFFLILTQVNYKVPAKCKPVCVPSPACGKSVDHYNWLKERITKEMMKKYFNLKLFLKILWDKQKSQPICMLFTFYVCEIHMLFWRCSAPGVVDLLCAWFSFQATVCLCLGAQTCPSLL